MMAVSTTKAAGTVERYGLDVVDSMERYCRLMRADPRKELKGFEREIPSLCFDIRYAGRDNFTGEPLYRQGKAFLRAPAVAALKGAQAEFNRRGFGIKVFDAYRPYSVTVAMWDFVRDERYVAAPWTGSRHNRGCALDITLVNLANGEEVAMPTAYDDFSEKAHLAYGELPEEVIGNRQLLVAVMAEHGFTALATEWWHFDYAGWQDYELLDIPFEVLMGGDAQ